jgi:hypothetical protein
MSGLNKYIENAAEEKKMLQVLEERESERGWKGDDRGGNSAREREREREMSANTNVFFSIM